MRCFTYNKNKIASGVLSTDFKTNLKTCALSINMPADWDVETFLELIKSKEYCDILLYCNVKITEGDSNSSVFPEDCILLYCMNKAMYITNIENSCLEIRTEGTDICYVLFNDSALFDAETSKYIINDNGSAIITNTLNHNLDSKVDENLEEFIISL